MDLINAVNNINSFVFIVLIAFFVNHSALAMIILPPEASHAGLQCLANYFEDKSPGKIVELDDGLKMHFIFKEVHGSKLPTIVFEGGRGENSLEWNLVKDQIPKNYSTFSYDRAGYGWSGESTKERTAENIAKELNQLLEKAGIFGKIILVGHSSGGIYTRVFAKMYPKKVHALLLVDSASEHMLDNKETKQANAEKIQYFDSLEYVAMAPSIILKNLFPLFDKSTLDSLEVFGPDIQEQCVTKMVVPKFFRTMRKEIEQLEKSFKQLGKKCPNDTVIISAEKNDKNAKELQSQLFRECGNEALPQIWVDSGHNIQREQPGIIAHEIIKLIKRSK